MDADDETVLTQSIRPPEEEAKEEELPKEKLSKKKKAFKKSENQPFSVIEEATVFRAAISEQIKKRSTYSFTLTTLYSNRIPIKKKITKNKTELRMLPVIWSINP